MKRGFLLVQHHDHDLDVLRYHGCPDSGWKGSTKWVSLMEEAKQNLATTSIG